MISIAKDFYLSAGLRSRRALRSKLIHIFILYQQKASRNRLLLNILPRRATRCTFTTGWLFRKPNVKISEIVQILFFLKNSDFLEKHGFLMVPVCQTDKMTLSDVFGYRPVKLVETQNPGRITLGRE